MAATAQDYVVSIAQAAVRLQNAMAKVPVVLAEDDPAYRDLKDADEKLWALLYDFEDAAKETT